MSSAEPTPPVTLKYVFVAFRESRCAECNFMIWVGDRIAKLSNGLLIHVACI